MLGAVGLHLGRLPDDADGFRDLADLEGDVAERDLLVGGDRHSAAFVSLEPLLFDAKVVGVRLHGNHGERPGLVGHGGAHFGGAFAGHGDFGAGDRVTRWVHHVPGDGSGSRHLGRKAARSLRL